MHEPHLCLQVALRWSVALGGDGGMPREVALHPGLFAINRLIAPGQSSTDAETQNRR